MISKWWVDRTCDYCGSPYFENRGRWLEHRGKVLYFCDKACFNAAELDIHMTGKLFWEKENDF